MEIRIINDFIAEPDWYSGNTIMVWSRICQSGRKSLSVVRIEEVIAVNYRDKIFESFVIPLSKTNGPNYIFKAGNTRPHRKEAMI